MTMESLEEVHFFDNGGKSLAERAADVFLGNRQDLKKFKPVVDICPCPIFMDDEKGNCILVNDLFLEIIGGTLEEMQGVGWQDLIAPEFQDEVIKSWSEFLEGESKVWKMIYPFVNMTTRRQVTCVVTAGRINGSGFVGFANPV